MPLINDFLEHSAERTPGKVALVCGQERLSYAQLDEMANRLANALRQRGVEPGDRVALFLPNSVELAVGIFATLKAGAVFVAINSTTKAEKLAQLLGDCRARALVTRGAHAATALEMTRRIDSLMLVILAGSQPAGLDGEGPEPLGFEDALTSSPATRPAPRRSETDLACLVYTSGSSGDSRGVMSSHGNIVFAASSIITFLENTAEDVVICALPLSFDYGLYQLLMTLRFGGTLVLERSFVYPAHFLQVMQAERVTGLPAVPTMFAILLQTDTSTYDLGHLRYITNTAAALPQSHVQRLGERFPQAALYSMYGLTETKRTLYLPPDQLAQRPDSVGIAIPDTEVWIVDENDERVAADEIGELVVRGKHVMQGYWEDPVASAERFRPGPTPGERVCYTGDLFRMDEQGYCYFVGRKDDIIKTRGEKVAPKEVENALCELPGVVEVAAVGVPDEILGQAIKVLVVTGDHTLTEKDVLRHCKQNLEDFMLPKHVVFCDELPKTDSLKVQKRAIE